MYQSYCYPCLDFSSRYHLTPCPSNSGILQLYDPNNYYYNLQNLQMNYESAYYHNLQSYIRNMSFVFSNNKSFPNNNMTINNIISPLIMRQSTSAEEYHYSIAFNPELKSQNFEGNFRANSSAYMNQNPENLILINDEKTNSPFKEQIIKNDKQLPGKIIKRSIKNKKLVYDYSNLPEKIEKKEKFSKSKIYKIDSEKLNSEIKKSRASKFRGVSRNGNQWQVLIMVNKKKRYVGSYDSEFKASRTYDIVCIQNHGSKAKTNYLYSQDDILEIIKSPKILKIN